MRKERRGFRFGEAFHEKFIPAMVDEHAVASHLRNDHFAGALGSPHRG